MSLRARMLGVVRASLIGAPLLLTVIPGVAGADAKTPQVSIEASCVGVDHRPLETDLDVPEDRPSAITVGATVDGATQGARATIEVGAPDGEILTVTPRVDENGRIAAAIGISSFGTYVATDPIVISFTDPNTGQPVETEIDPSAVFPADGFVVGPEEVACDAADLPPGTLLGVAPPTASGPSGSKPPGTGSQPPVQPPVSSGDGGSPVIWIVVIGGGVVLTGGGLLLLQRGRPSAAPPVPPVRPSDKEGTVPQTPHADGPLPPGVPGGTQEKPPTPTPPDPRGFDPKKQPFPEDDGIPWILEWKLDALIWNQFAIVNALNAIGWVLAFGLAAIIGLLAAILAAIQAGFALLAGLLGGILALLAFFVIRLVVPLVMEREREKLRTMHPPTHGSGS